MLKLAAWWVAVGLSWMTLGTAHASETAAQIRALLQQGKAQDAWQLGRRHADLLGTPEFDLVFGIAAINAGKASEGVLALERVLLASPDNTVARLELARGYFLLGEDARSREEFEALLERKPPPDVARVINEYLEALAARSSRFQPSLSGYAEFGGGHDSNVPSGVEDPNITLPVFGEISLADSAVRASDRYLMAGAGIRFSRPVAAKWQAFATLSGEQRANRSIDVFDQEVIAGAAGLSWQLSDRNALRFTFGLSTQTIDHRKYRDSSAFSAEWGRQLGASTTGTIGYQRAQFRYGGFNTVRDADYDAISLGLRWRGTGAWRPDVDLAASGAREKALLGDRQDLSRDLTGFRAGLSLSPAAAWTISLSSNWLKSDYLEADPLLLVVRNDRYLASEVALTWALPMSWARNLSLRVDWINAHNKSNLALYEYKRRAGGIKLRYDFK